MGLKADLEKEVAAVFRAKWDERDGNVVPEDDSLTLGNDAVKLEGDSAICRPGRFHEAR